MTDIVNVLFTVGNLLLFTAAFPTFISVMRNRTILRGYNAYGSLLTYIGLVIFMGNYVIMNNWGSIIFATPTLILWGVITFYMITNKYAKYKKDNGV